MQAANVNTYSVLLAAVLGLLVHAAVGYEAFPVGDDFAYAPLADFKADPTLFASDVQLQMFANHAIVYEWLYAVGQSLNAVEAVVRSAILLQSIMVCIALLVILARLGAPLAALPAVLGLGIATQIDGLGRGDFGGLVATFFHHHNVALALILASVAAVLSKRYWFAGVLLGVSAYAQPMTAFHGAAIVGLGVLATDPRQTVKLALASAIVALPAALPILHALSATSETVTSIDPIQDAYRFRAPAHYDPPWETIRLSALYLLAGGIGAVLLARSQNETAGFAMGATVASGLLLLITVIVYKGGIAEWTPLFILDANRSSPLVFVLGPAFALAGIAHARPSSARIAAALVLAGIFALNYTVAGIVLLSSAAVLYALSRFEWVEKATLLAALIGLVLVFPPPPKPGPFPKEELSVLAQIRDETPKDALFVIPVSMFIFRHYAQRSAYVDFKLFSVAQVEQAALTRDRIDTVLTPAPEHQAEIGWSAVRLWDEDQRKIATCSEMTDILKKTGADYYLRRVAPGETPPSCSNLPRTIESTALALYGPLT